MTVSYINLMKAQQQPRAFGSGAIAIPNSRAEMIERAVLARRRLMSGTEPPAKRLHIRTFKVEPYFPPAMPEQPSRKRDFIDLYAVTTEKRSRGRRRPVGMVPNWPPSTKEMKAAEQRVDESLKLQPILLEVAVRHKMSVRAMLARGRRPSVVRARHEFSYVACELMGFSLIAAGLMLRQDRSSIRHGIAVHKQRLAGLYGGEEHA